MQPFHDNSYVGEDAWDDVPQSSQVDVTKTIDSNTRLSPKQKEELKAILGTPDKVASSILQFYHAQIPLPHKKILSQ